MSDLPYPAVQELWRPEPPAPKSIGWLSYLHPEAGSTKRTWISLTLVLAAIAAIAYTDHLVVSLSLVYLYVLPLIVGAIFLRKEISYGLILACVLFHYFFHNFDSPRNIHLGLGSSTISQRFCVSSSLFM